MPSVRRVKNIGEAAFATTGGADFLEAQQHGYTLFITTTFVTEPAQTETAAARVAVAHLP
jgi:hypothetical protein